MVEAQIRPARPVRGRLDGRDVPVGAWVRRSSSSLVRLLALAPGRCLHREQVLDALWPKLPPEEARPRLHTATHYARRALGERSGVAVRGEVMALFPGADVDIDVVPFLWLAHAEGEDDAARRLPGDAALCLQGAGQPLDAVRGRAAVPTLAAAVVSGPDGPVP
jgi:DNA-binding SARP family transcriptional activator